MTEEVRSQADNSAGIAWVPTAAQLAALNNLDGEVRGELFRILRQQLSAQAAERAKRYSVIRMGQICAFALAVIFISCATIIILMGYETAGTIIAGIDILGLVTAFLAVSRTPGSSN